MRLILSGAGAGVEVDAGWKRGGGAPRATSITKCVWCILLLSRAAAPATLAPDGWSARQASMSLSGVGPWTSLPAIAGMVGKGHATEYIREGNILCLQGLSEVSRQDDIGVGFGLHVVHEGLKARASSFPS